MTGRQLLVSLSSYGAAEVRRHGQSFFVQVAAAAGADGVEVRGELLDHSAEAAELHALADAIDNHGLRCVYSSAEGLFDLQGMLDTAALDRALHVAQALRASPVKMSIGGYGAASAPQLAQLRDRLGAPTASELVIENDQTDTAGTVPALEGFFEAADQHGLALGLTFDLGNWHWLGECPLRAAQSLGARVRYVHCKGVQRLPHKWVAVPLADSVAPWRAVLRELPGGVPWAIEYPLVGDDLVAVTRSQLHRLRSLSADPA